MEINLKIIIDNTLFRNIKSLKKTFFYNLGYNIEAEIWKTTKGLKDDEYLYDLKRRCQRTLSISYNFFIFFFFFFSFFFIIIIFFFFYLRAFRRTPPPPPRRVQNPFLQT